jgi:hypothetical protein
MLPNRTYTKTVSETNTVHLLQVPAAADMPPEIFQRYAGKL